LQKLSHDDQRTVDREAIENSCFISGRQIFDQGIESGHTTNLAVIENVDHYRPAGCAMFGGVAPPTPPLYLLEKPVL
jgi:hypothetical protein